MESDPPADPKVVQRIICPICGIEGELILPPRDPERCVALQRLRCDSCGIERTVFLKFPDEEEAWGPQ